MKKSDVVKYLIELSVVFVGITGAFLLNSWREEHRDAQLEKKYLISFKQEISDNGRELQRVIELNAKKNERINRYIQMILKEQVPEDSAVSMLGEMMRNYPLMPTTNTQQSITGSGNLNLISDFELKQTLINYYNGFDNLTLQENIYFDYITDFIIPFVNAHMDMASQTLDSYRTAKSREFRNLILGYSLLLRQNLRLYKQMADRNSELENRLLSVQ